MITKQQIEELRQGKNTDVGFVYNEGDVLIALQYGYDKHYLIKPRLGIGNEHLIVIRDRDRKYDIRLY